MPGPPLKMREDVPLYCMSLFWRSSSSCHRALCGGKWTDRAGCYGT